MAELTKIEWTDHTFNPWEGCQRVGPGCDHCYAESRNARFGGGTAVNWGPGAPRRRTSVANWKMPIKWNEQADAFFAQHGRRQRVFCASLADVFDNAVDPAWRVDLFGLIAATPNLDWLLLTKRIGNAKDMIFEARHALVEPYGLHDPTPLPNFWIGATVVNQEEANRDVHKLLAVPAAKRFLSMEPLLGPVDLSMLPTAESGHGHSEFSPIIQMNCLKRPAGKPVVDWVIVGGESGSDARPMHPQWARDLRDQCAAAGTPFLFKQWGEWGTAAVLTSTGMPVFRQFADFQTWVNKASTWVNGGICLDSDGRELRRGSDMARARDEGKFPVTIMHRVGKKAAGRLLDGGLHDGVPSLGASA